MINTDGVIYYDGGTSRGTISNDGTSEVLMKIRKFYDMWTRVYAQEIDDADCADALFATAMAARGNGYSS